MVQLFLVAVSRIIPYDVGMKGIKKVTIPPAVVQATEPELVLPSKTDPDYFKILGRISARKRKNVDFSAMAKLSHGPTSKRDGYHGGRKKKGQE